MTSPPCAEGRIRELPHEPDPSAAVNDRNPVRDKVSAKEVAAIE
jgi:hypothetical protein